MAYTGKARRYRFRAHGVDVPGDEVVVEGDPGSYDEGDGSLEDHLEGIDNALGAQSVATEVTAEAIDLKLQKIEWHLSQISGKDAPDFCGPTAMLDQIIYYLEQINDEEAP